jgi:hypothetical protein
VTLQQFSRPALQITVTHNGEQIDIVTAHLKSKLLTFGGIFDNRRQRARTAYFALGRRAGRPACANVTGLLSRSNVVVPAT